MAIHPDVRIGHVHLKVADLQRALSFYCDVLGFALTQSLSSGAAFISAGGYHHHIGLNTWESAGASPPPAGHTGLYHHAILFPTRRSLAEALRRVIDAGWPLTGASDHGVSESLYLNDPDGNGVELYRDRPREEWPRATDGSLQMTTVPLDVQALLREATAAGAQSMTPERREQLQHLRTRLLNLHKALLDDARVAYELDRGSVGSSANL